MSSYPNITIPYIQHKFDDFNRQYFGNQLPPIPIKLSNAKTFLGKVCFRKERKLLSRKWHYFDFVLRINTRIALPEEVVGVACCKNPRCITSQEQGLKQIFVLRDAAKRIYRCKYCEEKLEGFE